MHGLPLLDKLQLTLFQVISARTAGFVSVPFTENSFSHAGFFLLILLMFVGASPGGTGGGIKTTTFAVLLCSTRATLEDRHEVVINRRRISAKQVLRAAVARDRENPFAWYQLGVIYAAEGDMPRARLASAEQQVMNGKLAEALVSSRAAQIGLPQGSPDWLRAQDIEFEAKAAIERAKNRR